MWMPLTGIVFMILGSVFGIAATIEALTINTFERADGPITKPMIRSLATMLMGALLLLMGLGLWVVHYLPDACIH